MPLFYYCYLTRNKLLRLQYFYNVIFAKMTADVFNDADTSRYKIQHTDIAA